MASAVKNPIEVLNALFDLSGRAYAKLTDKDKKRNFFIVNRRLAIGLPNIAFGLATMNVNEIYAMDFWHRFIRSQKMRKPSWMYLKLAKKQSITKIKFSNDAKEYYMKVNDIGPREFDEALKFCPDEMKKILQAIDKQLKLIKK